MQETRERQGSIPGPGRSPGGGRGNPLQYSGLEKPVDRGAWCATVPGVAQSRAGLSDSALTGKKGSVLYTLFGWENAALRGRSRVSFSPLSGPRHVLGCVWVEPVWRLLCDTRTSFEAVGSCSLRAELRPPRGSLCRARSGPHSDGWHRSDRHSPGHPASSRGSRLRQQLRQQTRETSVSPRTVLSAASVCLFARSCHACSRAGQGRP